MLRKIRKHLITKLARNDAFLLAEAFTETGSVTTTDIVVQLTENPRNTWIVSASRQYPERPKMTTNRGDE